MKPTYMKTTEGEYRSIPAEVVMTTSERLLMILVEFTIDLKKVSHYWRNVAAVLWDYDSRLSYLMCAANRGTHGAVWSNRHYKDKYYFGHCYYNIFPWEELHCKRDYVRNIWSAIVDESGVSHEDYVGIEKKFLADFCDDYLAMTEKFGIALTTASGDYRTVMIDLYLDYAKVNARHRNDKEVHLHTTLISILDGSNMTGQNYKTKELEMLITTLTKDARHFSVYHYPPASTPIKDEREEDSTDPGCDRPLFLPGTTNPNVGDSNVRHYGIPTPWTSSAADCSPCLPATQRNTTDLDKVMQGGRFTFLSPKPLPEKASPTTVLRIALTTSSSSGPEEVTAVEDPTTLPEMTWNFELDSWQIQAQEDYVDPTIGVSHDVTTGSDDAKMNYAFTRRTKTVFHVVDVTTTFVDVYYHKITKRIIMKVCPDGTPRHADGAYMKYTTAESNGWTNPRGLVTTFAGTPM